jgi:hypothetical protein
MMMQCLILESFRCFREYVEVPLRPLTLLVGENSTGKTSLLAAFRIAATLDLNPEPDFNSPPFELGAFDQIASFARGRHGRAHTFRLGYTVQAGGEAAQPALFPKAAEGSVRLLAAFESSSGQPRIVELRIEQPPYGLVVSLDRAKRAVGVRLEGEGEPVQTTVRTPGVLPPFHVLLSIIERNPFDSLDKRDLAERIVSRFRRALRFRWRGSVLEPHAGAPIRAKPRRTYDPKSDAPEPEGNHVPMMLARIVADDPARWKELRGQLERFGAQSGLFKTVSIRRYGSKASGPFQLRVKVSGTEMNILDVGYGVSQALPVVTDALIGKRGETFLLQQPEVHLHPRGQAAVGSLFGYLVKERRQRFLVETHSDYLLDRICLDVRDGRYDLRPEDVVILYFEREGPWVTIHPIHIDGKGNLVDAPPGYRRFFLDEQARHFGVGGCV